MRDMLYRLHIAGYPRVVVFSGTEEGYDFYKKCILLSHPWVPSHPRDGDKVHGAEGLNALGDLVRQLLELHALAHERAVAFEPCYEERQKEVGLSGAYKAR